ncbi:MAG: nicotinate phosphoribosyltransferase [Clostridia bacterium]|nr:nicotinate phosphoribosyltransferase [Clostridia bacterium]
MTHDKLSLISDSYTFSTANGFFSAGIGDTPVWFDMFCRHIPDNGGFGIMAGTAQLAESLDGLSFSAEDLDYLRERGASPDFLDYLKNFRFECDISAVPEGTPIFAGEPIVSIHGPAVQCQIIETLLLMNINHQSLIATKANRMVRAAQGRSVVEFGSRRAHGADAAFYGARAAYIGGCSATTCSSAARELGIPLFTGMNHSYIQMFDSELDAFRAYARSNPNECVLLIDTYDAINSGLPNAIKVFREELAPRGFRPKGVRIDSGDLAYLSKKIRRELNDAGFPDCDIIASNSLDEYIIRELIQHGARIDGFLCGERLVTASSDPVFSGVYKLAAIEKDGEVIPKIKLSENVSKITTPCPKHLWRLFDRENGKAMADLLTLTDEDPGATDSCELFDPDYTWKRKTVTGFVARQLLEPVFTGGKNVYRARPLADVRAYCLEQVDALWEEVLRFENPHNYYVDLSQRLWDIKYGLIDELRG